MVVKVRTAPPHGHLLVRSLELLLAPWLLLLCNELILCFSMDSLSHVPHLWPGRAVQRRRRVVAVV